MQGGRDRLGHPQAPRCGKKAGPPVHDDLVERDFTASGPNELWLTGITEHPTSEGKVYLCAIKDVWSNRIVGYSIADRMKASLAVAALANAIAMRNVIPATDDDDNDDSHTSPPRRVQDR